MRKLIMLFFFSIAAIGGAEAQKGHKHISLHLGYVYSNAYQTSLSFDISKKYYTAHSFSLKHYRQDAFDNYLLGYNYKPALVRNKNTTVKWTMGVYGGTDLQKFIVAPSIGFEVLQSLSPQLDIVFSNDNGYYIFAEKASRWRMSAMIGFRLPL